MAQPGGGPPWMLAQTVSACIVLKNCILLARDAPQLSSQTAFKLGAASCLVFGPGTAALNMCVAAALASHPGPSEMVTVAKLAAVQIDSVVLLMTELLQPSSRPQAAAAFASSTAKPSALLPWLAALSAALPLVVAGLAQGEYHGQNFLLSLLLGQSTLVAPHLSAEFGDAFPLDYVLLFKSLLSENTWDKHAAAIAADPALQQAVVGVLLGCCLPDTARFVAAALAPAAGPQLARSAAHMLFGMGLALQHSSLAPIAQRQLQAGGAEDALEHAAAIVRALPTSRPSGESGPFWSSLVSSGASLLATLSTLISAQPATTAGNREAAEAASHAEAAFWHVARLLPRLAASLAALASDPLAHTSSPSGMASWLADLDVFCYNMRQLHAQAYALSVGQCNARQLTCWLDAVAACLRLAPCLAQLARLRQENRRDTAALLYSNLLDALSHDLPRQLCQLGQACGSQQLGSSSTAGLPPDEAATWGGLPAHLWALHTSLCHFVAALTSAAAPLHPPGERLSAESWRTLQWNLSALLVVTTDVHRLVERSPACDAVTFAADAPRQVQGLPGVLALVREGVHLLGSHASECETCGSNQQLTGLSVAAQAAGGFACCRRGVAAQLQAMCVGHVAALQAAAAAAGAAPGPAVVAVGSRLAVLEAATVTVATLPAAADAPLLALLEPGLDQMPEVRSPFAGCKFELEACRVC